MTEIDQRLHRAGRRLREMPVEVPSLESLGIGGPPVERHRRGPRAQVLVPAAAAATLLFVGGVIGFGIGHGRSIEVPVEAHAAAAPVHPAPTAADRMRDPIVRVAPSLRARDELALMPATPSVPRRQVRWS